jgi:hypothetical protein
MAQDESVKRKEIVPADSKWLSWMENFSMCHAYHDDWQR